jgi:hypothetical protein
MMSTGSADGLGLGNIFLMRRQDLGALKQAVASRDAQAAHQTISKYDGSSSRGRGVVPLEALAGALASVDVIQSRALDLLTDLSELGRDSGPRSRLPQARDVCSRP